MGSYWGIPKTVYISNHDTPEIRREGIHPTLSLEVSSKIISIVTSRTSGVTLDLGPLDLGQHHLALIVVNKFQLFRELINLNTVTEA